MFERIFVCPHFPEKNCGCRKPKIGLLKKFLREKQLNKSESFVCGDRKTDEQFALNLGIKFIPIKTNNNFYVAIKKGGVFQ